MWSPLTSVAVKATFLLVALACSTLPAKAALITLVPEDDTVETGVPFDVDVLASLDPAEDLAAYFIDVIHDALALQFESVAISDALGVVGVDAIDVSLPPDVIGNLGVVNISVESFLPDFTSQPDELPLATLTYTALTSGPVALEFGDFPALDDPNLVPINVEAVSAEVAAVPAPSVAYLLAIGAAALAGAAGFRRR